MNRKKRKDATRPHPLSWKERNYRQRVAAGELVSFEVTVRETDLQVQASRACPDLVLDLVLRFRSHVEGYIAGCPAFLSSLAPLASDPLAPAIVRTMLAAGETAGVGPMASVAGALSECVGRDLLAAGIEQVVVENGGDIFLARNEDAIVGIWAGASPLSGKIGLRIGRERMPVGVCTSSGTVGHSLSFGDADAVVAVARDTALADAAATAVGNAVRGEPFEPALEVAQNIPGLLGVVIVRRERLAAWGEVELVRL